MKYLGPVPDIHIPFDYIVTEDAQFDEKTYKKVGDLRISEFPYCCGIQVTTQWDSVPTNKIREYSRSLVTTRGTGMLLWSGVPNLPDDFNLPDWAMPISDQSTIDRLLANGWKLLCTFKSRMQGNYPVVLLGFDPNDPENKE